MSVDIWPKIICRLMVIVDTNNVIEEFCQCVWNWQRYEYFNLRVRLVNEYGNDNNESIIDVCLSIFEKKHTWPPFTSHPPGTQILTNMHFQPQRACNGKLQWRKR